MIFNLDELRGGPSFLPHSAPADMTADVESEMYKLISHSYSKYDAPSDE